MISLIHPSRGRPEKSFKTVTDWCISSGVETDVIVSIDQSDANNFQYYRKYAVFDLISLAKGSIIINDNTSVVDATNRAAEKATGDILLYLSDDFKCFPNWGVAVEDEFAKYSGPTLIKVDDCLQKFHVPVLTIPIMNRELYTKLGYFFHPDFKSMFCDEHLYWKTMQLGALKFAPHLKFEHCHVSVGKAPDDETYRRSARNWEQGKAMFAKHKAEGFK
jgi:hypothetical protein